MSSENESNGAPEQQTASNRLISEFNLLTDQNKTAYIRLSVFPDNFERDAFEAVSLAPYQRLEEWRNSGLVEIVSTEKAGQVRYRIPECVGTWLTEGLEKSGETLENQLRFARHFACFLQKSKGAAPSKANDPTLERENFVLAANILLTTQMRNFPDIWHIGFALTKIESKESDRFLLLAIERFESSLKVIHKNISPENWGKTQNNIAFCYMNLRSGGCDRNIREAISRYEDAANAYSEMQFPKLWSDAQFRLGGAYKELPLGDRNANLRNAISCFLAALKVRTLADHPQEFATTQMSLGGAYLALEGEGEANYRNAILCFEAALKYTAKTDFPRNWAISHHNLGLSYSYLQSVDSSGHFEKALEHFRTALEVRSKSKYPEEWAQTQFCLGNAYRLISKERWGTHLQDAIKFYQEALTVFTEQDNPDSRGDVQNNLGVSYLALTAGDRTSNLILALECFDDALRVANREENPRVWAMRQGNFGLVLSALGRKRDALDKFEEARTVYRQLNYEAGVKRVDANIKLAQGREEGKQYPASRNGSPLKNGIYRILDNALGAVIALFEWV